MMVYMIGLLKKLRGMVKLGRSCVSYFLCLLCIIFCVYHIFCAIASLLVHVQESEPQLSAWCVPKSNEKSSWVDMWRLTFPLNYVICPGIQEQDNTLILAIVSNTLAIGLDMRRVRAWWIITCVHRRLLRQPQGFGPKLTPDRELSNIDKPTEWCTITF